MLTREAAWIAGAIGALALTLLVYYMLFVPAVYQDCANQGGRIVYDTMWVPICQIGGE